MKEVVLFSGGLDSTVLLHGVVRDNDQGEVLALSFKYGSKHNENESDRADLICTALNVERRVIELDFNAWGFKSDLLTSGGDIPEGHYADESMKTTVVPFRNGIMLAIAVGVADSIGAENVSIASHSGDHPIYPDCRPDFTRHMNHAAQTGTYGSIKIHGKFQATTKENIVRLGASQGAEKYMAMSWSCYQPRTFSVAGVTPDGGSINLSDTLHCGKCGTCVERLEAFELAGVEDRTIYAAN